MESTINWQEPDRLACAGEPGRMVTAGATVAVGALMAVIFWGLYVTDLAMGLDIAVAVVALGLVPVSLRWPLQGGLALAVPAALSPLATPAATVAALFAARQRRFPVARAVAGTGIAAHAVRAWWRPPEGVSYPWWLVLISATYAALIGWGALARARQALLVSLRERARRAEAEQGRRVAEARAAERARIAREMHDVLAHRLSLLATYAGALEYRPDSSPEQLSRAAGVVRAGVRQALEDLRQVITVLRADDGTDPVDQPQPVLTEVPGLVEESRDAGSPVRLDNRIAGPAEVPAGAGRAAYRVIQEALTNARKHAAGQPVLVVLDGRAGQSLTIDVRNPMPTRPDTSPVPGTGTGLVGLTERVRLAGGQLDHEITAAGEFRLHARLPWPT